MYQQTLSPTEPVTTTETSYGLDNLSKNQLEELRNAAVGSVTDTPEEKILS